jgi:hypothetical protein
MIIQDEEGEWFESDIPENFPQEHETEEQEPDLVDEIPEE